MKVERFNVVHTVVLIVHREAILCAVVPANADLDHRPHLWHAQRVLGGHVEKGDDTVGCREHMHVGDDRRAAMVSTHALSLHAD